MPELYQQNSTKRIGDFIEVRNRESETAEFRLRWQDDLSESGWMTVKDAFEREIDDAQPVQVPAATAKRL